MFEEESISPAIQKAAEDIMLNDAGARQIDELSKQKEIKISELEEIDYQLNKIKSKRKVDIRWRDSVKWCLEVDSRNPSYFLKNAAGVYNCIAFKHKIDITPDMKNKIATTLSSLFKEKTIGRIMHDGSFHYGISQFFNDELNEIKEEYKINLSNLKQITVKV